MNRSSFAVNMFVVVGDVAAKFIKTCGNGDALLHKSVRQHCFRIDMIAKAVLQYREKAYVMCPLRAGPSRCGVQSRTWARTPLISDIMMSSCSVNRVPIVVERRYAVQHHHEN